MGAKGCTIMIYVNTYIFIYVHIFQYQNQTIQETLTKLSQKRLDVGSGVHLVSILLGDEEANDLIC